MGFSNATAVAIVVSGTNFIFSLVNLVLVDRFGRRAILRVTVLGMAICMLLAAISFHYIPISKDLVVETTNIGWPGILVLVCIIAYVAFFSSGVATIAWIGVELIPMEVRAVGTMMVSHKNPPSLTCLTNTPEHRHLLVHEHHYRIDVLEHDERPYSIWRVRLLLWHLHRGMDLHYVLLSRVQGHAFGGYSRGLRQRLWRQVLETVAEGQQAFG